MCLPGCNSSSSSRQTAQQLPAQPCDQVAMPCDKLQHFVIWFGAPGVYDSHDRAHDGTWQNYVYPIWTAMKERKLSVANDELVHWCVYMPGYEARWKDDADDQSKKWETIKNDVSLVKNRGAKSYVDYFENRAKEYRALGYQIVVRMLTHSDHFWKYLEALPNKKLRRVWYLGHASEDLWLTLYHNSSHHAVMNNRTGAEVIQKSHITSHAAIKDKFSTGALPSKFIGCNTAEFAKEWHNVFSTSAEGAEGKVDFGLLDVASITADSNIDNNGHPGKWKKYP